MAFIPLSDVDKKRGSFVPIARNVPTPQEDPSLLGGALTRGAKTVQSDFSAAGGLVAQALGFDETAQSFYNRAAEIAEERDSIARRVGRVEDIKNASDLGVFAIESLVENAPLLASIAIPGFSAAKLAGVAGSRAAISGTLARGSQKAAAQAVRRKKVAGTMAAFLSDVGLQTGESAQIASEAGQDPLDLRVVGSGLGKGALDFVPILVLAKKLGLTKGLPFGETVERVVGGELVKRGFIRRAIGNAATLVAVEVPTETAQEIINIALDRSFSQFEGEFTAEEKSQMLNAAAGAATFGLLGVPAAAVQPSLSFRPATEAELTAGEDAAIPKQLTGPEQPKLLPAPALRVTPEGQVLPPGVEEVDYDPTIDTPQAGLTVAQGVANALGKESVPSSPNVFLVTPEGVSFPNIPDTHEVGADQFRTIPELVRTPTEQAVVLVDDARAATIITSPFEIAVPEEHQKELPPLLKTLVEMRDDTFLRDDLRRSSDGQLTKAGKARIASIDKRISALSARLGLPNPLAQTLEQEITDAEKQLSPFNAEEEARRSERPDSRLTPAESALLEKLEETDIERELSVGEATTRERLIAKREGEEAVGKEKLTAEEIKQLRQEGNELGDEESVQIRRREDELQSRVLEQVASERADIESSRTFNQNSIKAVENMEDRMLNDGIDSTDDAAVEAYFQDLLFRNILDKNATFALSEQKDGNPTSQFALSRDESRPATPKLLLAEFRQVQGKAFGLRAKVKQQGEAAERLFTRETTLRKQSGRFRKGGGKGLTVRRATAIVQRIAKKFVRGPEFIIVDTTNPDSFRQVPQRKRDVAGSARGAFFLDEPNNVYIFADRHSSEADLARTVLHETLAHFGLRAYFAEEELNSILESLYKSRSNEIQDQFGIPQTQDEARTFAEEYIASIAENGTDQTMLERVIAWVRRAFRRIVPGLKLSDNDIRFMLRDVSRFITAQIPARNRSRVSDNMSTKAFLRAVGPETMESVLPQMESLAQVWGNKFLLNALTPLQISDRFPIPGVREYIEQVQLWSARKGVLIKNPGDIANRWQRLPGKEAQLLSQAILEASELSDSLERALTQEEELALMKKLGAPKVVYDMFKEVRDSFKTIVDLLQVGLERAVIREAVKDFSNPRAEAERVLKLWQRDKTKAGNKAFLDEIAGDPKLEHFKLGAKLINVGNDMDVLRNRNYFPRMRFGQYGIFVRAKKDLVHKGKKYKGPREGRNGKQLRGEMVNFEAFEDVPARNQRRPSLEKQFGDQSQFEVSEGYIADEEFSFLGMPPALFDALKDNLSLDAKQIEQLKELYHRYSPGKAFLRHLTQRKGVDGYSTEAMRVYATYMMNAANHIARIEFSEEMNLQRNVMRESVRNTRQGTTPGLVQNYFDKHFQYIMNPENDLAVLRSWGFLFYLGFNTKSALVNLTQVPMVAYPFLAHHYGDGAATAAIGRAYATVSKVKLGKLVLDNKTDAALTRGIEEGFLDESLATELAGIGESDVLQRIMPQDRNVRLTNEIAFYGSFMFKHAEKFNREVVFLAARELALKKDPENQEGAFLAARKAVQATMFEYKKWNRPNFMRGKKSVFFLFWQYMQHLSFMAYGGEGKGPAMRVWGMLLLAAGLQGLPFAENILDIADFGGTQAKEALGLKDPRVDLREMLREFASSMTDRPDLIMHGLSRYYGLGPVHLMGLLGVPVPQTDISGSLSAGRVIPGTDQILTPDRDPNAKFGRTTVEVLGPVMGMGYNIWKALESDDPDQWKVWERAMPTALKSASAAVRRGTRGEETFRGGGAVVEFDPNDPDQFNENIAQAFGFATTRVNQRFALRSSQQQLRNYWVVRRTRVMENMAWAILSEDKEGLDAAQKRLNIFNKQAPSPQLRINAKTLRESVRERFRRGHLREIGMPNEKAFRGLFRKLEETNPEGVPER